MEIEREHASWRPSLRVVVAYVVFLTIWIVGSDALVAAVASDPREITQLQTAKGIAFALVSASLLYLLIKRTIDSLESAHVERFQREAHLSLALSQLPANVWTTDDELRITSIRGQPIPAGSSQDAVGKTVPEAVGSQDPLHPATRAHHMALSGRQERYVMEWKGATIDNTVGPLRDASGRVIGCLGFSLDVTDRMRLGRERVSAVARLERLNRERESLLRHLVRAEESERKRIAEGIHDDSIQVMTSAGMAIDLLMGRLTDAADVELAKRGRELVSEAIARLRSLVFHLRPLALDEAGLAAATRLLLKKTSVETGLEFTLSDESTVPLEGPKLHVTYQIIQEAIANVRKHSGAHRVDVRFRDGTDGLLIRLEDDGSGFDPDRAPEQGHFGLTDMRERAAVLGGTCNVTTSPEGTSIDLWVPWAERPVAQTVST